MTFHEFILDLYKYDETLFATLIYSTSLSYHYTHEMLQHYHTISELMFLQQVNPAYNEIVYYAINRSHNINGIADGIFFNIKTGEYLTIQNKFRFINKTYSIKYIDFMLQKYKNTDILMYGFFDSLTSREQMVLLQKYGLIGIENNSKIILMDLSSYNNIKNFTESQLNMFKDQMICNLTKYQNTLDLIKRDQVISQYHLNINKVINLPHSKMHIFLVEHLNKIK